MYNSAGKFELSSDPICFKFFFVPAAREKWLGLPLQSSVRFLHRAQSSAATPEWWIFVATFVLSTKWWHRTVLSWDVWERNEKTFTCGEIFHLSWNYSMWPIPYDNNGVGLLVGQRKAAITKQIVRNNSVSHVSVVFRNYENHCTLANDRLVLIRLLLIIDNNIINRVDEQRCFSLCVCDVNLTYLRCYQ